MKPTKPIEIIQAGAGAVLEGEGFRRKGNTWFRESADRIEVVNFQKSSHGQQYFVNIGFWFSGIQRPASIPPKEFHCHARARLGMLCPAEAEDIERLLDFTEGALAREAALKGLAEQILLPAIKRVRTKTAIQRNMILTQDARRYLQKSA